MLALLGILVLLLIIIGAVCAIRFFSIFAREDKHYPDPVKNAIIPANMRVNLPDNKGYLWKKSRDFQLNMPIGSDLQNNKTFPSIFNNKNREVILRHLSTSSRWLLINEIGDEWAVEG